MSKTLFLRLMLSCFVAITSCCLSTARVRAEPQPAPSSATGEPSAKLPETTIVNPERRFDILQYGAVESAKDLDNIPRNTKAIQKAIDACAVAGRGRVVVPPGTFLTGTLVLRSNVTLHLERGAVLLGSPRIKDYPLQKPAKERRYNEYLGTSLIFARAADRVAVTGEGTLNGNSKATNDFLAKRQVEGRRRPTLIWFDECTNISVKGITLTSAGFWTNAYSLCRNLHIDGIRITDSTFMNNDGCDIVDCENVIVEHCDIDALDDAICLKSFMPCGCKNVVIRNNRLRSLCNAIKMGTDSSGGFQNVLIEDNKIHQTGIAGIALESVDGGTLQNVIVRNIVMDVVGTPIFIRLGERKRPIYEGRKKFAARDGQLHDVHISGIVATVDRIKKLNEAERRQHNYDCYASSITGIPGHPVERIQLDDIHVMIQGGKPRSAKDAKRKVPEKSRRYPENRMFGVLPAYGFYIRHAKNVKMKDVHVVITQEDGRPAFVLDDVHASTFENVETKSVSKTPSFSVNPNCTGVALEKD
ncbi:MAG: right-handed parallel beta-helix repeat-containing protein [Pirellulales bacterium]|nr:right-handed parallel beta-helix repeat-containing protein [Pirellulales bacterium]